MGELNQFIIYNQHKKDKPVITGVVVCLGVVTATCLTAALVPCVALAVWQSIVHTESCNTQQRGLLIIKLFVLSTDSQTSTYFPYTIKFR